MLALRVLFALVISVLLAHAQQPVLEYQTVTFSQTDAETWHQHQFTASFSEPPVIVAGGLTYNGGDQSTLRLRNVTASTFEYQLDEWDYRDGNHTTESMTFLAIESGVHQFGGLTWEAKKIDNVRYQNKTVALTAPFTKAPLLLTQATTINNLVSPDDSVALISRIINPTATNFETYLRPQESFPSPRTNIVGETLDVIAISQGLGTIGEMPIEVGQTTQIVTQAPYTIPFTTSFVDPQIIATIQSHRGGDPCALRITNLNPNGFTTFLEEEQSKDPEIRHVTESVGYLAIGSTSIEESDPKLQITSITADQTSAITWTPVSFGESYQNPVVVAGPASTEDGDPLTIRIRNVSSDGFEFQLDEWDYLDGIHGQETFSYLVMEAGTYNLDGLRWEAGKQGAITESQTPVNFVQNFSQAPVVIAQVTSANETEAVIERIYPPDANGFSVFLQEEENINNSGHGAEELHFIAVEEGSINFSTSGNLFQVASTATNITHEWRTINFASRFADPSLLADMQTVKGMDPSSIRHRNLRSNQVDFKIEEEASKDSETNHTTERIGFLVIATAVDSDHDGLPDDWETQNGLNPNDPADADLDADNDGTLNLDEYYDGTNPNDPPILSIVSLTTVGANAFEKEGIAAQIRITRDSQFDHDLTITFEIDDTVDPSAPFVPAAAGDFILELSNGNVITEQIIIPAGESSVDLFLRPLQDFTFEYPETVSLALLGDSSYELSDTTAASLLISDAQDIPENETPFIARFRPEGIADTNATGLASLRLNGSNTQAFITTTFSGLSSAQTEAHLHHIHRTFPDTQSGPLLITLPLGQLSEEPWNIIPDSEFSGQDLIDSLTRQNGFSLYLDVHSENYPAGEIRARFRLDDGSLEFQVPSPPPTFEDLDSDELRRDAARFLTQATFGVRPADLEALISRINNEHNGDRLAAYEAWIDEQFALDLTSLEAYTRAADQQHWDLTGNTPAVPGGNHPLHHNRRHGWWPIAIAGHDQLRQRVGMALSEIFVISEVDDFVRARHYGTANYYDMLCRHADGSFRTLLEDVSKHPMMGRYLSHLMNRKAVLDPDTGEIFISPDENYAREIMQLFSIGLVELHPDGSVRLDEDENPIPTYDNTDITELARVFTGWSFGRSNINEAAGYPEIENTIFNGPRGPLYFQGAWTNPMKNFADYHDSNPKSYLGITTPAGIDGEADLDLALDTLLNHPNTGPFISRLIIQRLVTSNPSRGYLYRVAQAFEDNGAGVRGDLKAVIKAILLDYEARTLNLVNERGYGKVREHLLVTTQVMRLFDAKSGLPVSDLANHSYAADQLDNFSPGASRFRFREGGDDLAQSPLRAPSVFNWFLPDYAPTGDLSAAGLVAPELQIANETAVIGRINHLRSMGANLSGISVDRLPRSTDNDEENVALDFTAYIAIYDAHLASVGKAEAVRLLIDNLDDHLMAGNFRQRYPDLNGTNPRSSIINTLIEQTGGSRDILRTASYLITSTPEFLVQK